jgi:hypothetical protein
MIISWKSPKESNEMNRKKLIILICSLSLLLLAWTMEETFFATIPMNDWPSEVMVMRPDGVRGRLVAYDMANGRQQFSLPAGLFSADETTFAATSQQGDETLLEIFDMPTGSLRYSYRYGGRWQLSSLSAMGDWLTLTREVSKGEEQLRQRTGEWQTEMQVVAVADGRIAHSLQLDGHFDIEAIAADGSALFLIHYVPAHAPDRYNIRLYNLVSDELVADPLREKGAAEEVMTGYAWGSVMSPNGRWLLTLYQDTGRNAAFIHALNMSERWPVCLDLPSLDGTFSELSQYTLALSPVASKVYAANPALGILAEINLLDPSVRHEISFTPVVEEETMNAMVVSADGAFVYFTNGRTVWQYNTADRTITELYTMTGKALIHGLTLNGEATRLYLGLVGERPLVIDTMTGENLNYR